MTKNLETADRIAKLALSVSTVVLFFTGIIAGPFARWLVILSFVIIGLFVVRLVLTRLNSRNRHETDQFPMAAILFVYMPVCGDMPDSLIVF